MANVSLPIKAGDRFGLLLAIEPSSIVVRPKCRSWVFLCDCGVSTAIDVFRVWHGIRKSCGCQGTHPGKTHTHRMSESSEYTIWLSMKRRCLKPQCKAYKDYGARGITVCESWMSFENFFADMGARPSKKHTLERRDNDGPYSPDNCYWATRTTQARNKRNNRIIEFNGERRCVAEWEEILGFDKDVVSNRICEGWDEIRALTTPRTANRTGTPQLLTCRGETLSLREWARRTGRSRAAIKDRMSKGATPEVALFGPNWKRGHRDLL